MLQYSKLSENREDRGEPGCSFSAAVAATVINSPTRLALARSELAPSLGRGAPAVAGALVLEFERVLSVPARSLIAESAWAPRPRWRGG